MIESGTSSRASAVVRTIIGSIPALIEATAAVRAPSVTGTTAVTDAAPTAAAAEAAAATEAAVASVDMAIAKVDDLEVAAGASETSVATTPYTGSCDGSEYTAA